MVFKTEKPALPAVGVFSSHPLLVEESSTMPVAVANDRMAVPSFDENRSIRSWPGLPAMQAGAQK